MNLRPVKRKPNGNRYCGPAAISALTGLDTDEAAREIRHVTGKRSVTGVHTTHLLQAFRNLGFRYSEVAYFGRKGDRPTLAGWLKISKEIRTTGRVFLVVAGRHFQLISGRRYVCGLTRDIVSVRDPAVKRRARVKEVWELQK